MTTIAGGNGEKPPNNPGNKNAADGAGTSQGVRQNKRDCRRQTQNHASRTGATASVSSAGSTAAPAAINLAAREGLSNTVAGPVMKSWSSIASSHTPDIEPEPDTENDCTVLGSYNWFEKSKWYNEAPTICVPGEFAHVFWYEKYANNYTLSFAPIYHRKTPQELRFLPKDDKEEHHVDINRAHSSLSPLEPLFRSVAQCTPAFRFDQVDVVTHRNNLQKILSPNKNHRKYRIYIELVGRTLLCERWDGRVTGAGKGYGHAFEKRVTRGLPEAESYHRVITYNCGGLKMVVRTEVDAVNPDPNVPDTTPILPTTTALGFEGTTLQCLASDNAIPQQSRVAELKCFYDRNPWEARDTLQCVLGRVPTGYCARHLSSRMGENFMADIQRIDEHHFSAMDFIDPVIGSQLRNFFGAIRKVMAKRGVSKTVLIGDLKAGIQLHPMGRDRRAALPGSLVARMLETPSKPEDKKNGKATEVDVSTDKTNKVPCSGTPKPQQTKVANEPVTSSGGKSNSRTPSKRKAEGEADEEAPESKKAKTGDDDDDKIEEKQCTRTVKMTRFKNNREVHEWEERGKKEVWRK